MRVAQKYSDVPKKWYNIIPAVDFEIPPLRGASGFQLSHHDLDSFSVPDIIDQELERDRRDISIPDDIHELYANWRPTPLYRAEKFEKSMDTPARIFYKYEAGGPSWGHEMNTAVAQAYYASLDSETKCIVSATGNGEWGVSLAIACNYFGIKCKIYMVRSSYEEKEYGHYVLNILSAEVILSPSETTKTGKKILAQHPQSAGSLGIALSEAMEDASGKDDTKFAWGTVVNHVLLHQTVIGLEAREQMNQAGARPDIIIGAVGGGSGFGGLAFPFYNASKSPARMIAVETADVPSLSRGRYAYDYADAEGLSPLLKMYTLGHRFVPPGIRAGGMRYHGISPIVSSLYREKQIEARAYTQYEAFEAGIAFSRTEGMIPSPESSYAVKAVMDEAISCRQNREKKDILFLLDANSNLDITVFKDFVEGAISDQPFKEDDFKMSLESLPQVNENINIEG